MQIGGLSPRFSNSVGLSWSEFAGDTDAAELGNTL